MIKVSLTFNEVTIADGSQYLVNPIQATNGFNFETMTPEQFIDWKEDCAMRLYDLTIVRVPSEEAKQNGSSLLGRLQNRYGFDCNVERVQTLSNLGDSNNAN
jgi:hypothetical protein